MEEHGIPTIVAKRMDQDATW